MERRGDEDALGKKKKRKGGRKSIASLVQE
jgi:hypothetical protein